MSNMNMDFHLAWDKTELVYCGYMRFSLLNMIPQNLNWICQVYGVPDIVVLIMGSNDIMQEPDRVAEFADQVCQIGRELMN